jgi:hypothetical protein
MKNLLAAISLADLIAYDLVSMTLITMQAEAPNDSVPPLPVLAK